MPCNLLLWVSANKRISIKPKKEKEKEIKDTALVTLSMHLVDSVLDSNTCDRVISVSKLKITRFSHFLAIWTSLLKFTSNHKPLDIFVGNKDEEVRFDKNVFNKTPLKQN